MSTDITESQEQKREKSWRERHINPGSLLLMLGSPVLFLEGTSRHNAAEIIAACGLLAGSLLNLLGPSTLRLMSVGLLCASVGLGSIGWSTDESNVTVQYFYIIGGPILIILGIYQILRDILPIIRKTGSGNKAAP